MACKYLKTTVKVIPGGTGIGGSPFPRTVRSAKLKSAVFEDFGILGEFYTMSEYTTRQI